MGLTIVANIFAVPEKQGLLKQELENLIAPTLEEEGCVQYDLHQDNEDPNHFLFFEQWENRELWQAHMKSDHLAAFLNATEGAVANLEIYEMSKIENR